MKRATAHTTWLPYQWLCFAAGAAISTTGLPAIAQSNGAPRVDRLVEIDTSKGPIIIRVAYAIVPYTAGNFLDLVSKGFYDGLTFHRVENWVVQGGDPNGNGSGGYIDPATGQERTLHLETTPTLNHNRAGMVAMARSNNPNSASSQFYILKAPMPQLNGKYAVFGIVVRGMDSVNAMRVGDRISKARILPLPEENQPQAQSKSEEPAKVPTGNIPQERNSQSRSDTTRTPKDESGFSSSNILLFSV